MKKYWIIIIILFPWVILAQPQGKLFIHSGFVSTNELGYIQYPQNQYHAIDSGDLDDMLIVENKLLVCNDKIYIYDISTLTRTDSINTSNSYMLDAANNKLAVTKSQPPYFEMYDLTTKNLVFSLNTSKVKSMPVDILLDMGRAYLLFETSIEIIDLNLQDTIANIDIFPQFSFPAYSQYLINKDNKVYIDVELATGAPRFSIFSLHKNTLQITQELFTEFVDTPFEPVLAGNKLYMSFFPSCYDIAADTFIYIQNTNMTYPLCFDEVSQTMFLYKPLDFKVNYFNNTIYSSNVAIPTYLNKAVYYNEASAGIPSHKEISEEIYIYPNPATNELNIKLPFKAIVKEIRLTAMNGTQTVKYINSPMSQRKIDISSLDEGMYFLEIQFENQLFQTKFIKTGIYK